MTDHIQLTPHLHEAGFEQRIAATFLGQAHIAGTGPVGKTCRECKLWFIMARPGKDKPPQPPSPGHFGKKSATPNELKRANCNYAIPHKSKRRIPHDAKACRFFEQSENPPAIRSQPR